jgi:bacteriocin-like protein
MSGTREYDLEVTPGARELSEAELASVSGGEMKTSAQTTLHEVKRPSSTT